MNGLTYKTPSMCRYRPKMDHTRALGVLGFNSGAAINEISMDEIQSKFNIKMHQAYIQQQHFITMMKKTEARQSNKRRHSVAVPTQSEQETKQLRLADDLDTRIIHEAFQCLIKKKRRNSESCVVSNSKEDT